MDISMPTTCIALVELNSQADILANLIAIENAVRTASLAGARLVVLPENAFGFGNQAHVAQFFEPLKNWCGDLARQYQIYLLAGTLPCPFRPNGTMVADKKFRQSSLLFDPSGASIARYDKIHLFKATVNDSTGNYDEGKTFEAGDTPVVAKTDFGNIGMMVCFDLRFAPLALTLRDMGADILTTPSAFTYQTGKAHWQSLLTARALDSQCLVIGAGQTGEHFFNNAQGNTSRTTWGHSAFINANGEVVGKPLEKTLVTPTDDNVLIHHAKGWLASDNNAEPLSVVNASVQVTDFDISAQNQWRQHINLQASQRFNLQLSLPN